MSGRRAVLVVMRDLEAQTGEESDFSDEEPEKNHGRKKSKQKLAAEIEENAEQLKDEEEQEREDDSEKDDTEDKKIGEGDGNDSGDEYCSPDEDEDEDEYEGGDEHEDGDEDGEDQQKGNKSNKDGKNKKKNEKKKDSEKEDDVWGFIDHPDPDSKDQEELGKPSNRFVHMIQFWTRGKPTPWTPLGLHILWSAFIVGMAYLSAQHWGGNDSRTCRWFVSLHSSLFIPSS